MGIGDYFRSVETMTAEQVREYVDTHKPDMYNLVDVRQPTEYQQMHLPGAQLIPLPDLPGRLKDLDPAKPTITYCRSGMRSRAAASVLETAGFKTVASMAGGITAWRGHVAAGPPEAGMAFFTEAADAGDLTALAWLLEEGSRKFYSAVAEMITQPDAAALFNTLVKAEEKHKGSLEALYREITGKEPGTGFPRGLATAEGAGDRMEGNLSISKALAWAKGKDLTELLELSMALETDSFDLYIKMGRIVPGENSRRVFARLVAEEKEHLARMAGLFDKYITRGPTER